MHEFTYPVQQVWIDPDRPGELFDRHPLWSHRRASPIRFRPSDYFRGDDEPVGPRLRALVADALAVDTRLATNTDTATESSCDTGADSGIGIGIGIGTSTDTATGSNSNSGAARRAGGPIRLLTQPRTWGWLFNPISVYLLWADDLPGRDPSAAVLEVTNTPWKERHLYPLALERDGDRLRSRFAKTLHVSPFLGEDMEYRLTIGPSLGRGESGSAEDEHGGEETEAGGRDHPADGQAETGGSKESTGTAPFSIAVDAMRGDEAVVQTALAVVPRAPTGRRMWAALARPAPTHRVSLGIHTQAARLWRKRVPFVPHPDRRRDPAASSTEKRKTGEPT